MKPAGVSGLLRWYPRRWRERYGDELLTLIEDTLDGRPPTLRLHLSVAWGGLRERARQALPSGPKARRLARTYDRWTTFFGAGLTLAILPPLLDTPARSAAWAWPMTAALDAMLALIALTAAAMLAGGAAALPALVRFLRTGGWPTIRYRIWLAAGATIAAGGALAALVTMASSHTLHYLNTSQDYLLGTFATSFALAAAIGLWTFAIRGLARQLEIPARARAAELMLAGLAPTAVSAMVCAFIFWFAATESSVAWFLAAMVYLAFIASAVPRTVRRAARRGRRLGSAAAGGR